MPPLAPADLFAYISAVLAALTIVVALAGIFAFLSLRRIAKSEARRAAKEIAETKAEETANLYIQAELPELLRIYMTFGPESVTIEQGKMVAKEGGD